MLTRNEFFMLKALDFAKAAGDTAEIPVGAVLVLNDKILASGFNKREKKQNALFHAEIECIALACSKLRSWRLTNCDIYTTLEPCIMCVGAIINSRIKKIIFGAKDVKNGACFSNRLNLKYSYKPQIIGCVLEKRCSNLLHNFFEKLRFQHQ